MTKSEKTSFNLNFGNAGIKTFSSIQKIQEWREKERQYWEWLQELPSTDRQIMSYVTNQINGFYNHIDIILRDTLNVAGESEREAREEQLSSLIETRVKELPIVFSDSPEAKYLDELRRISPVIAAHTAGYMLGVQLNPSSKESLEGAFLAIAYRNGFQDKSKSERESLQSLHSEWSDLLKQSKASFEAITKEHKEFGEQYANQIGVQRQEFDELKVSFQNEFKSTIEDSEKELKGIAKTYDEKLALQAAVGYWKTKAISHAKAAKILSWATAIVGIVVMCLLSLETYFVIGPLQKISEIIIWKGGMVILTAVLGVWAIRILVRLLLSNFHLKAEAVERRTMLLTYLALLRRGQGPSENQREVILQILFRPSSTGIIKDDALPPIAAQWLNTVTTT